MRYFILRYYRKPTGQMDESMTLAKRLRDRDLQEGSVILDFRDLKVVKASLNGQSIPKDWDRIMTYYHRHYPAIMDRLLRENGYEIVKDQPKSPEENTASA